MSENYSEKELTMLSIDDRLKVSITNRQTRDYFSFLFSMETERRKP